MTKSELIDALQPFDDDAEVLIVYLGPDYITILDNLAAVHDNAGSPQLAALDWTTRYPT